MDDDAAMHSLPKKKKVRKNLIILVLLLLSILLLLLASLFFYKYKKLSSALVSTQATSRPQEDVQKLVTDVGKLLLLPKDETPTIATVSDIDKLKDQPFFKNAQNGNKVLIYPNSKLAIIYDIKSNLIVNVGPINFSQSQTNQVIKTRIGLRNGTNVEGLTNKVESEIKNSFSEVIFALKEQGKNVNIEKTIVVVLNDSAKSLAENLSKALNITIDNLPANESKPKDVDILIIVGKDKI